MIIVAEMFPGLPTFGKHGKETMFRVIIPNFEKRACPLSGNMARKECFLLCSPSGNMARK